MCVVVWYCVLQKRSFFSRVLIVLLTNLDILTSALFRTKHESFDRNLGEKYIYYLASRVFL